MGVEPLARATNSSDLEMEEGVVKDVDRVAAMATGSPLGGLLFRYREGGQRRWGKQIIVILSRRVVRHTRLTRSVSDRVAAQALLEWSTPLCTLCGGAREVLHNDVMVVCPQCVGSGTRRWTDEDRKRAIGLHGSRVDKATDYCHAQMTDAMGAFLATTREHLKGD